MHLKSSIPYVITATNKKMESLLTVIASGCIDRDMRIHAINSNVAHCLEYINNHQQQSIEYAVFCELLQKLVVLYPAGYKKNNLLSNIDLAFRKMSNGIQDKELSKLKNIVKLLKTS